MFLVRVYYLSLQEVFLNIHINIMSLIVFRILLSILVKWVLAAPPQASVP